MMSRFCMARFSRITSDYKDATLNILSKTILASILTDKYLHLFITFCLGYYITFLEIRVSTGFR